MVKNRVDKVLDKYLNYSHVIEVCHEIVIKVQKEVENIPRAGVVELHM